jgi:hypothetical protein
MSKPEDERPTTDEEVEEELRTRQPLYEELAEQPPIESPPAEPKTIRVEGSPNTSTQPTERVARLVTQLAEARVNPRCSACGHDEWDYGLTVTTLPLPVPQESGEGLEVFTLICTNCGQVRIHSAQHVENRAEGY